MDKETKKLSFRLLKKIKMDKNKKQVVLIVSGILGVFIFCFFIYTFFLSNNSISYLLPSDKTVAFIEFNNIRGIDKLGFNKDIIVNDIERKLDIDISSLDSWIGNKIGMAMLQTNGVGEYMYFIKITNTEKAIEFFNSMGINGEEIEFLKYRNYKIYFYPYSRTQHLLFIDSYLIISSNPNRIKDIIDTSYDLSKSLRKSTNYKKVYTNLPKYQDVFGYIDYYQLKNILKTSHYRYLLNLFVSSGISIKNDKNNIKINTYTFLDKGVLPKSDIFRYQKKFKNTIFNSIPKDDLIVFLAGDNLEQHFLDQLDIINKLNKAFKIVLDQIIELNIRNYFGDNISFKNDILSLFSDEYAFYMISKDNILYPNLVIDVKGNDTDKYELVNNLLDKLLLKSTSIIPEIREKVLPNGKIVKELISKELVSKKYEQTYNNYIIKGIEFTDSLYSIYYFTYNNKVYVSTYLPHIKRLIDNFSLNKDNMFDSFKDIRIPGDEIGYINLEKVLERYPLVLSYINKKIFNYSIWSTKLFDDGLSTEMFIKLYQ